MLEGVFLRIYLNPRNGHKMDNAFKQEGDSIIAINGNYRSNDTNCGSSRGRTHNIAKSHQELLQMLYVYHHVYSHHLMN